MAFTSIIFMVFTPFFFISYFLVAARYRHLLLAVFSLIFYAYWDIRYVPLIFISAFVDYYCSLQIHNSPLKAVRRFWLLLSLSLNLGILFFFKYWNFFIDNLGGLTGIEFTAINVILPLGISFYTLQTLSYTFDTYRGKLTPEKNFGIYFIYVSYFPQLVAGPIERASSLLPQLRKLRLPSNEDIQAGIVLIAMGFFAKMVIADNIAGFISYGYFESEGGLILWPLAYLSVCQVYCDFFGYTLIARGLASCMGVRLSLNFRQPLFAKNMTAFWQRWHITLTKWVTDYIHIPLARRFPKEPMRSLLAIFAMCIIGLWHGASWNFVLFGLINGLIMRFWNPISAFLSIIIMIKPIELVRSFFSRFALFLSLCFVGPFFFIRDTDLLLSQVRSMFSTDLGLSVLSNAPAKVDLLIGVAMLGLFLFNDYLMYNNSKYHVEALSKNTFFRVVFLLLMISAIFLLGNFNTEAFIYFEF